MITQQQCRAARELLGWGFDNLAQAAGITQTTVLNFELGHTEPYQPTQAKMSRAFEAAGVEFFTDKDGGPGVRKRKPRGSP